MSSQNYIKKLNLNNMENFDAGNADPPALMLERFKLLKRASSTASLTKDKQRPHHLKNNSVHQQPQQQQQQPQPQAFNLSSNLQIQSPNSQIGSQFSQILMKDSSTFATTTALSSNRESRNHLLIQQLNNNNNNVGIGGGQFNAQTKNPSGNNFNNLNNGSSQINSLTARAYSQHQLQQSQQYQQGNNINQLQQQQLSNNFFFFSTAPNQQQQMEQNRNPEQQQQQKQQKTDENVQNAYYGNSQRQKKQQQQQIEEQQHQNLIERAIYEQLRLQSDVNCNNNNNDFVSYGGQAQNSTTSFQQKKQLLMMLQQQQQQQQRNKYSHQQSSSISFKDMALFSDFEKILKEMKNLDPQIKKDLEISILNEERALGLQNGKKDLSQVDFLVNVDDTVNYQLYKMLQQLDGSIVKPVLESRQKAQQLLDEQLQDKKKQQEILVSNNVNSRLAKKVNNNNKMMTKPENAKDDSEVAGQSDKQKKHSLVGEGLDQLAQNDAEEDEDENEANTGGGVFSKSRTKQDVMKELKKGVEHYIKLVASVVSEHAPLIIRKGLSQGRNQNCQTNNDYGDMPHYCEQLLQYEQQQQEQPCEERVKVSNPNPTTSNPNTSNPNISNPNISNPNNNPNPGNNGNGRDGLGGLVCDGLWRFSLFFLSYVRNEVAEKVEQLVEIQCKSLIKQLHASESRAAALGEETRRLHLQMVQLKSGHTILDNRQKEQITSLQTELTMQRRQLEEMASLEAAEGSVLALSEKVKDFQHLLQEFEAESNDKKKVVTGGLSALGGTLVEQARDLASLADNAKKQFALHAPVPVNANFQAMARSLSEHPFAPVLAFSQILQNKNGSQVSQNMQETDAFAVLMDFWEAYVPSCIRACCPPEALALFLLQEPPFSPSGIACSPSTLAHIKQQECPTSPLGKHGSQHLHQQSQQQHFTYAQVPVSYSEMSFKVRGLCELLVQAQQPHPSSSNNNSNSAATTSNNNATQSGTSATTGQPQQPQPQQQPSGQNQTLGPKHNKWQNFFARLLGIKGEKLSSTQSLLLLRACHDEMLSQQRVRVGAAGCGLFEPVVVSGAGMFAECLGQFYTQQSYFLQYQQQNQSSNNQGNFGNSENVLLAARSVALANTEKNVRLVDVLMQLWEAFDKAEEQSLTLRVNTYAASCGGVAASKEERLNFDRLRDFFLLEGVRPLQAIAFTLYAYFDCVKEQRRRIPGIESPAAQLHISPTDPFPQIQADVLNLLLRFSRMRQSFLRDGGGMNSGFGQQQINMEESNNIQMTMMGRSTNNIQFIIDSPLKTAKNNPQQMLGSQMLKSQTLFSGKIIDASSGEGSPRSKITNSPMRKNNNNNELISFKKDENTGKSAKQIFQKNAKMTIQVAKMGKLGKSGNATNSNQ